MNELEALKAKIVELECANAHLQESERRACSEVETTKRALAEAEARYRAIGEAIPYGVWTSEPTGGATYFSNSFLELIGKTLEESMQFGWTSRLPSESADRTLAAWMYCVEQGNFWDYEYTIFGTDDRYHTILSQGVPVRDETGHIRNWVGINLDITERKRIEEMQRILSEVSGLLASSLDYETTLTNLAHFMVPTFADWCIVDMLEENDQVHRIEIASADPAREKLLQELQRRYPPDRNSRHPVAQVLRTGEPLIVSATSKEVLAAHTEDAEHLRLVLQLNLQSGIVVPLIAHGRILGAINFASETPNRYSSADFTLFDEIGRRTALAVDNAYLYHVAQEAVRTQKELDDLKDLFMAVASHELRNPLTALKGYAQMLQRSLRKQQAGHVEEREQTQRDGNNLLTVETILLLIERMNGLIGQLLDFSRVQNKQLELQITPGVDLGALVKRIVEQQRIATKDRILQLEEHDQTLLCSCDVTRFEQVINNLISNAFKYSPVDTSVTVGIESRNGEGQCAQAVIWVQDQGQGIDEEHQSHIFDRFYRVRSQSNDGIDGLGLGLYISQQIMTQHGGRLWLKSTPGRGTTFFISLPLVQAENQVEEA